MCRLPRIAIGSIQSDIDLQPMLGALLEVLRRGGVDSQAFQSQSCFVAVDAAQVVNGKRQRHLDSWLMSPAACRRSFCYGSQGCDLSIVVGHYRPTCQPVTRGGTLEALCHWLELPNVVLLDVSRLGPCCLPDFPSSTAGVLLMGLESTSDLFRWQTYLESHAQVPLLGAIQDSAEIREQWAHRSGTGGSCVGLVHQLADQLSPSFRWDLLSEIANETLPSWTDEQAVTPTFGRFDLNVAIAYDDAFNCYFPDTLDALEMQGAKICDFSPLKGDKLPAHCELVLFGCGHPERFAETLSRNHCMKQALHHHIRAGGRVYAEGGGLAYVSRTIECSTGRFEMAGLLPAIARRCELASEPVEFRMSRSSWLAPAEATVRGYQNPCWRLKACPGLYDYSDGRLNVVGHGRVIGSRMHLHFSSQPRMMKSLLRP